jgi:tetratricopeptide (TPR) repeat protein
MKGIECFNTAIKLSPEDDYLYYKRFRQYKYKEIFSNALEDINTAISLDPDYSFYLVHRGKLNKYMGNVREMENDCRKVVEMEMTKPEDEREMLSLAYAYALMGDKTTATPLIDKIYEGKETRVAEYDRACLCCLIGDSESALKHLEKALRAGLCCFEDIRKDKDFDIIREHPTFKQLIDEYQKKYGTRYPTDYQLHPEKYKRENTFVNNDYSTKYFNFYEWSNLDSAPRRFTTLKYFIDFLDNSKIHYTPEDKNHLSTLTYAYCTCTKGKPDLLIANTVYGLRELLEKFSSSDESETTTKWILCKDTNRYTYLRTVTYNKDGDVSSFTFCDIKSEAYVFTDKEKALKVSEDIKKKTADFINLTPVGLLN